MATFSSYSYSNHPMLINPPRQILKFTHNFIKNCSFKQICKQGSLQEAFNSLASLSSDQDSLQFSADEVFSPILELCATKKAMLQGQQIHGLMIKSNCLSDSVFLCTKLVFMYGKCGSILNAENMFDKMPERTIFTWNAMIGAYVTNEEPIGALELYREMRVLGVPLDAYTLPCVLKACGGLKDLRCGAEIHSFVIKCGYVSTVFVVNSLVAMYAKCNDLDRARKLFDSMIRKEDVVLWNSIISAYSASGQSMVALELFRDMQNAGCATNTYTFVAALQACNDLSLMKLGMEIHAAILKSSQEVDLYVTNALVAMYLRCGKMGEAVRIFTKMDKKDNVSWNSMLSGFVQNGLYNDALSFFHYMQDAGQKPDQASVISVVAACSRLGNLLNGMEVHAYAIKMGLDSDMQVGNTLVDFYAKCCCVNYMDRAFGRMLDKDIVSWTTIIAGYAQNNCPLEALELFRKVQIEVMHVDGLMIGSILLACSRLKCISCVKEIHGYILRRGLSDIVLQNSIIDVYGECENLDYAMRTFKLLDLKNVVSWTSMVSSYIHNDLANEALELFRVMQETHVEPDSIALVCVLSATASLSTLKKGKEIHGFLIRKGFTLEGSIASSLVDMYARCGTLENAYNVFNSIRMKDLILWTSMINAYGMHSHGKEAINIFDRMKELNLIPDHITFLALLYACSHSGLVNEGKRFLEIMKCEYQLEPWPEHYACLVDLLGRANQLEEAYQFVNTMQDEPTAEIWCALLGACRVHSNKELGEIAATKLLALHTENPGNYVLVSNLFAANGRWKDVEQVRQKMKGIGLKKNPGCSWIEVGNKVHTFMARDKGHPQSHEIYKKLAQITKDLESKHGYVVQSKFALHNVEEEDKVKILYGHSERLAIAFGLLETPEGITIRITKNLRVCGDCHTFCKLVSKSFDRQLIIRDANRFHHFKDGFCSCKDFW